MILTPILLTFIGIMLGRWLFATPFSATSMIGFIAIAGIIVRNSILLVDFVSRAQGPRTQDFREIIADGLVRIQARHDLESVRGPPSVRSARTGTMRR